jgi:hypothetical protein
MQFNAEYFTATWAEVIVSKRMKNTVRTINLQRNGCRGRRMKIEQMRMLQPTART